MSGQGDHAGPSLPPANYTFEEIDGVPTWSVPARNGVAVIQVVDDEVGVVAGARFREDELRGFAVAIQAAWSRAESNGA